MRWTIIWKVCGKKDLKCVGQMKDKIEDFIDMKLKNKTGLCGEDFFFGSGRSSASGCCQYANELPGSKIGGGILE